MFTASPGVVSGAQRLPLCSRYASVHTSELGPWCADGSGDFRSPLWALGATIEGDNEIIGVWSVSDDEIAAEGIAEELVARGVEGVRVLVRGAASELPRSLLRAFPDAVATDSYRLLRSACLPTVPLRDRARVSDGIEAVWTASSFEGALSALTELELESWRALPRIGELCRQGLEASQSFFTLSRRARAALMKTERLVSTLQNGACAAVRRKTFATVEAQAMFVQSWLVAAERHLRSSGPRPSLRVRTADGRERAGTRP